MPSKPSAGPLIGYARVSTQGQDRPAAGYPPRSRPPFASRAMGQYHVASRAHGADRVRRHSRLREVPDRGTDLRWPDRGQGARSAFWASPLSLGRTGRPCPPAHRAEGRACHRSRPASGGPSRHALPWHWEPKTPRKADKEQPHSQAKASHAPKAPESPGLILCWH